MPSGVVKSWNSDKGFGFIGPDDGGEDLFCHVSGLLHGDGSVERGDCVYYELVWDDRKGKERAGQVEATGEKKAVESGGGPGGGKSRGKAQGKGGSFASLGDALKAVQKGSPGFKKAWGSYCDLYFEGWKDISEHEEATLGEFFEYAAGLVEADLKANSGEEEAVIGESAEAADEAPAKAPPVTNGKRAASEPAPTQPVEKKKITVKKAVAVKIQELNASGSLLSQVRLGAVAGALSKLGEQAQLEALAALEEQAPEVEDPNEFLTGQVQAMLAAAEE